MTSPPPDARNDDDQHHGETSNAEHRRGVVRTDVPQMPDGYGAGGDGSSLIAWSTIARRLAASQHYWMASTRPDGRPHTVPRWGLWLDDVLYYDGSPQTVHARNLQHNPACSLHIGEGAEAIIVEGNSWASEPLRGEVAKQVSSEMNRKYGDSGYVTTPDSWSGPDAGGMRIFVPTKAMAWCSFPTDLTRYHFAADRPGPA